MDESDPHRLRRFEEAQARDYARALDEIRQGRKQTHWMWYVFPQFTGLGLSSASAYYAVGSLAEARAYLEHPTLGPRLLESCAALLAIPHRTAREILGTPDDLKLRSCATLFAQVAPPDSVFMRILGRYFGGESDQRTLDLIQQARSPDGPGDLPVRTP